LIFIIPLITVSEVVGYISTLTVGCGRLHQVADERRQVRRDRLPARQHVGELPAATT
jgi:hypothetical protein